MTCVLLLIISSLVSCTNNFKLIYAFVSPSRMILQQKRYVQFAEPKQFAPARSRSILYNRQNLTREDPIISSLTVEELISTLRTPYLTYEEFGYTLSNLEHHTPLTLPHDVLESIGRHIVQLKSDYVAYCLGTMQSLARMSVAQYDFNKVTNDYLLSGCASEMNGRHTLLFRTLHTLRLMKYTVEDLQPEFITSIDSIIQSIPFIDCVSMLNRLRSLKFNWQMLSPATRSRLHNGILEEIPENPALLMRTLLSIHLMGATNDFYDIKNIAKHQFELYASNLDSRSLQKFSELIAQFESTDTGMSTDQRRIEDNFNENPSKNDAKFYLATTFEDSFSTIVNNKDTMNHRDLNLEMNKLRTLNCTRDIIPVEVIYAINEIFIREKDTLSESCVETTKSLNALKLRRSDFNNAAADAYLNACKDAIAMRDSNVALIHGLGSLGFDGTVIDNHFKNIMLVAVQNCLTMESVLSSKLYLGMSLLNMTWSSLPQQLKITIENNLLYGLSTMPMKELQLTLHSFSYLGGINNLRQEIMDNIINLIDRHAESADLDSLIEFFEGIRQILDHSKLPQRLRLKVEEAFVASIKRGNFASIYNFVLMRARFSHLSSETKEFFASKLPSLLVNLTKREFSLHLKSLNDIKMRWPDFTTEMQDIILLKILKMIRFSDNDQVLFFTLVAFINLGPFYQTLSDSIKLAVNDNIIESLQHSSIKGFPTTVSSMNRMGMKYYQLHPQLRRTLDSSLLSMLPILGSIGVSIVLKALVRMQMRPEDVSFELRKLINEDILNTILNNDEIIPDDEYASLKSSFQTLFAITLPNIDN